MGVRLHAHDLAFGYPGKPVGRDVTLSVDPGEVLCLLGPNGSGKTTLFKTLLGLLPAQGGEVRIGTELLSSLPRQHVARHMSYVPQAHAAHFPFRVLDMVLMGRTAHLGLFASPSAEDRRRAGEALASLGIEDLADREYTRISGGQRQLALVARALAQDAPIIVMDEPTASLDFGNQAAVLGQIIRLAERGFAIVLSTHQPDHAFAAASRVALIKDGRVISQGPTANVMTASRLNTVYDIEVSIEQLSTGQIVCAPNYGASHPRPAQPRSL